MSETVSLYQHPDPMGASDPSLLAVDPSMNQCGVAIAQMVNPLDRFILASGRILPPREASDAKRVAYVGKCIKDLARVWNVQRIVVEAPTSLYVKKGRSLDALKVLLVIGGVYAAGGFLEIPVIGITVKQWKGSGSQSKDHSVALAKALWPLDTMASDDEAEARLIALGLAQPDELRAAIGLLKLGTPIEKVLGCFRREWQWGPREMDRIDALVAKNRLTGVAGSRKGRPVA